MSVFSVLPISLVSPFEWSFHEVSLSLSLNVPIIICLLALLQSYTLTIQPSSSQYPLLSPFHSHCVTLAVLELTL